MSRSRRTVLKALGAGVGASGLAGCLWNGESPEEQVQSAADSFESLSSIDGILGSNYRSSASFVRTDAGGLGEVFIDHEYSVASSPDDLDEERPHNIYSRLTEEGTYEPLGVGWAVEADGLEEPPTLFDREFHDPSDHHVPGQNDHYGLSVWIFDDDLDDLFAPVHPDLEGPAFVDTLGSIRESLDPYRIGDEETTEQGNYENTEEHIYYDDGLYGVPFYNDAVNDIDPERPPILLYHMTDQWFYELLGVEWYVPSDEVDSPPTLLEQDFHDPMPGHSPNTPQPEHYGLHAWLFRANPEGMFSLFNPHLA